MRKTRFTEFQIVKILKAAALLPRLGAAREAPIRLVRPVQVA